MLSPQGCGKGGAAVLLAIGREDNQVEFAAFGEQMRPPQPPVPGWWPAWRPGTAHAVTTHMDLGVPAHPRSELRLISPAERGVVVVPGSVNTAPSMIAERMPHYALWSPAGDRLCYVVPDGRAMALKVWAVGEGDAATLLSGAPVLPAWSPDGRYLVVHHANYVSLIDVSTGRQERLSDAAAGFRTPAFSEDSDWVIWAEGAEGGTVLRARRTRPSESGDVASGPVVEGGVALACVPGTTTLSYAVAGGEDGGVLARIDTVTLDEAGFGEPSTLLRGPLMSFWWSPDGSTMAVLHPTYSGDGRFQVRFHAADGGLVRAMEATTLSVDTRAMVGFFDQFRLSHPLWSSDGRWFTFGGRVLTDAVAASFSDGGLDQVLVADLENPGPWLPAGHGTIGFLQRDAHLS